MAPRLTLYYAPDMCSTVLHIILRRLQIPFDTVELSFGRTAEGVRGLVAADGSFSNADYRQLHPKSKVPGLRVPISSSGDITAARSFEEDDVADKTPRRITGPETLSLENSEFFTELPALIDLVTGLVPEKSATLFGGDALSRARVWEWTVWLVGHVQAREWSRLIGETAEIRQLGVAGTRTAFDRINDQLKKASLKGDKFAIGKNLTVADLVLYSWFRIGLRVQGMIGADLREEWQEWAAHTAVVEGEEGVRDAVEYEGIKLVGE